MLNKLDDLKNKAASIQGQVTDVEGQVENLKAKGSALKDKIKELGIGGLGILILGIIAQFLFPWWVIAIVAFYVGYFVSDSPGKSFAYGFGAMFLMWSIYAGILNSANGGTVTNIISGMIKGKVSGTQLIYLTGLIGGLVGGMGAMTGTLFRHLIKR